MTSFGRFFSEMFGDGGSHWGSEHGWKNSYRRAFRGPLHESSSDSDLLEQPTGLMVGALIGGVVVLVITSPGARRMVGSLLWTAMKAGGLSLLARYTYKAWSSNTR